MTRMRTPEAGFSLLEALIALSILAVAAAALIGAAEAHIDRVRGLEHRAVASWVAEDELTELRLASGQPTASTHDREMAGETWRIEIRPSPTSDPELARVDISVSGASDRAPAASLSGFVDAGAGS
ncbi:MAG: type II secretion system minor pseudopilin GspI [Alphaproteobacteria bacterium]|nr:type II secretion system minor pseudopilin GspI [Alphaproteobacteria bacterium]